jgi:hypothetical protein
MWFRKVSEFLDFDFDGSELACKWHARAHQSRINIVLLPMYSIYELRLIYVPIFFLFRARISLAISRERVLYRRSMWDCWKREPPPGRTETTFFSRFITDRAANRKFLILYGATHCKTSFRFFPDTKAPIIVDHDYTSLSNFRKIITSTRIY